jgi:cell cycle checkpoint control protein RAD9A
MVLLETADSLCSQLPADTLAGIRETYKLTFEAGSTLHALFRADMTRNTWSMSAQILRNFAEYFGPKTEQLEIAYTEGRARFTSYTDKVVSGKGIYIRQPGYRRLLIVVDVLKQPLHTAIAIDTTDFTRFSVDPDIGIIISVKDFRSIVAHAVTMDVDISAAYSYPSKPMQLKYIDGGVCSEFILMTMGDHRSASSTPMSNMIRGHSARPSVPRNVQRTSQPRTTATTTTNTMYAQPEPSMRRSAAAALHSRPTPPPPKPTLHEESLFVQDDEDDRVWNPAEFDDDEDRLQWDNNADHVSGVAQLRKAFLTDRRHSTKVSAWFRWHSDLLRRQIM